MILVDDTVEITDYTGTETEILIPDSLIKIEFSAFKYCIGLTDIVIPKYVFSIGNSVFDECINLKSIEVDKDNKYYLEFVVGKVKYGKKITYT